MSEQEVTDPRLLEQLEAPVSDPDLLRRLEGDSGSYIPRSIRDVPKEISKAWDESVEGMKAGFVDRDPTKEGLLESLGKTGKGVLSAVSAPFAPITGATRSLIGHPMATTIHAVGKVINPAVANKENYEDIYESVKPQVDTAIAAASPRGVSPRGVRPAPPAKPVIPTTEELFAASDEAYKVARALPVQFKLQAVDDLSVRVVDRLESALHGFRQAGIPQTYSIINELKTPASGGFSTISDIERVRSGLRNITSTASYGPERKAADIAIREIDNYLARAPKADVISGDHLLPALRTEINNARKNWGAGKRAELLEARRLGAEDSAAATGSGANINNQLRQKMRAILAPTKEGQRLRRGFNEEEINQIRKITHGTFTGNIARLLGKLAPTGVVSLWPTVVGTVAGGPAGVGIPIAGFTAKKIGEMSTKRQLQKLIDMTKERAPLSTAMAKPTVPYGPPSKLNPYPYMLPGMMHGDPDNDRRMAIMRALMAAESAKGRGD